MTNTMNVRELCDSARLRPIHLIVLTICFLTNVIDGLDTQVIGITASQIAADLHVSLPAFSLVLSAGTIGVLIGAMVLGRIADRLGRRNSLIIFTTVFGLLTLATPWVRTATELAALRFASGLGLGGAMPVFLTLVAEYAPKNRKALATGLLWCGYPIGGMIGGLVGSHAISAFGWQYMYILGGGLALGVAFIQLIALPESPFFLALQPNRQSKLHRLAKRLAPGADYGATTFVPDDANTGATRSKNTFKAIGALFADGRAATTLLLWLPLFCTFTITKFTVLWAPSLFEAAGMSVGKAALMQAIGNLASVPSMVLAGFFLDKVGPGRVLPVTYALVAVTFVLLSAFVGQEHVVAASMVAIGLLQGPGIAGLLFLATTIYPSEIRSTGVGFAMGVGRTGQVFVALFVGAIMALGVGPSGVILIMAAAPAIALIAVILLSMKLNARRLEAAPTSAANAAAE